METGVTRFDAGLGGIGGCPHAPGVSGNVAMEDVVYLMRSMGVATGIDFDALMALRRQLGSWLQGETLHGSVWKAGLPGTLLQAPAQAVQ
jgi:hydroxymethylglutaryl-CoA lyase